MHHSVSFNCVGKLLIFCLGWQLAVQQQVTEIQIVGFCRQLIYRIATVQQYALCAIDIGNCRFTGGRREKSWIKGKVAFTAEFTDVDYVETSSSLFHWQFNRVVPW